MLEGALPQKQKLKSTLSQHISPFLLTTFGDGFLGSVFDEGRSKVR